MPSVSVIVPVYNVMAYLPGCVASVLAQSVPDFELLLVDDGSTDESGALCDKLAATDSRIRVIHQQNKGLGGARNTGIEAASGQWLLFVDSDDTIAPETLEKSLLATDKHQADMVLFSMQTISDVGLPLALLQDNFPMDTPLRPKENPKLLTGMPSACNRLFARRLFLESGIRFPERVWYEDIRTTLKLLVLCECVVYLPQGFYRYRMHEGTITKNSNAERNREILLAFDDLFAWFREQALFEEYRAELEYLTVFHVYLTASVRVLQIDPEHPLLAAFAEYVTKRFPDYQENPYLLKLDRNKKMILSLLRKKKYRSIRVMFQIKGMLRK